MQMYLKKSLITVLCSSVLLLSACGDSDDRSEFVFTQHYVSDEPYSKDTILDASKVRVMTFKMPNVQDKRVNATAMVFYPSTPKPADGWRVVVWEHGTVGSGDSCAPSLNSLNPRFKAMAESLLKEGYVILAPDYEGLGTPGIHTYLHLESAAKSAQYAVKALQQHLGKDMHGDWMSVGQSQGGHASLGTAEFANGDNHYRGAVAAAPASSLGYIIKEIAPVAIARLAAAENIPDSGVAKGTAAKVYSELLAYAAYVAIGIKAYEPRFDYNAIFETRSQPWVAKAEGSTGENGLCLTPLMEEFEADINNFIASNVGKTATDYPGLTANFQENAEIAKFLTINQPATRHIDKPVLIIQGQLDAAVPYQVTQALAENLKLNLKSDVTFELVPEASHTQAIVLRNQMLVDFIKQHMPTTKS
ncbi:prolyl oligopeptidase family serine peptidase [Acinetobacter sp. YH12096]|uniref:alpha/beta hydrolase n=1 Tax=Acinetobacter sp. YH12096 TaxID=2601085 RepID=UPI0015D3C4DF|nr:prolyl oligopeptidase family serine peptidase [Acinetobacter sp. YH12096]